MRSASCPDPSTKIALLKDVHVAATQAFCLFLNMPSPPRPIPNPPTLVPLHILFSRPECFPLTFPLVVSSC